MEIANVAVVFASAVVYPTVTCLTVRSLFGFDRRVRAWENQHRTAYFGLGALLIVAVILLSVAGFYATPPFAGLSHFSSMFLAMMLLIELQIKRRKTSGYVLACAFATILMVAAATAWFFGVEP